jgi:hypothetical protein
MRTLLTRGLVEEAGTEPESGAVLYRTSTGPTGDDGKVRLQGHLAQPWTLIDFVREG